MVISGLGKGALWTNTKKQAPTQRLSGIWAQGAHESPRAALDTTGKETTKDTEGTELEGSRAVTSSITRNREASEPTGEAKVVPKREELTQVWPQQGLALRPKSPGNTKGYINNHPDTRTHAQAHTHTHAHHAHTRQQMESSWCLWNIQSTRLAFCQRPEVDGRA